MMKSFPDNNVMRWIDAQTTTQLFLTAITIAEISYGINALPLGKRRDLLKNSFNIVISEAFEYRVLSFDESAARIYGHIMGNRKSLGKPMSICDGQIAAIAYVHKFSVATRNINDFSDCDISLINPFI